MADLMLDLARLDPTVVLERLDTTLQGLSTGTATQRLKQYGLNDVAREPQVSIGARLWSNIANPLVVLLAGLALVSYITDDLRGTFVILAMIILGVVLRFFQEVRADASAQKLRAMVSNTTHVWRDGTLQPIRVHQLVPGDIITLGAGVMIPADVRILKSTDLSVDQSTLTGESMPVTKTAVTLQDASTTPFDVACLAFFGAHVRSGSATAVVLHTGARTFFGKLADTVVAAREQSSFDTGIDGFTWLMIRFIMVMVPIVFVVNWYTTKDWWGALLFASAVAVGLTPEMLPMIVSVNLSQGAQAMARRRVIVKRLNALQNFGAMDVLCTDKTGTLTEGRIQLADATDSRGAPSDPVLAYAFQNSSAQTGMANALDDAIVSAAQARMADWLHVPVTVVDELPFDFERRRMSVIIAGTAGNLLICKGAVDEVLACCTRIDTQDGREFLDDAHRTSVVRTIEERNRAGFRLLAVATRSDATHDHDYTVADEADLVLAGFLAFRDPPKASAAEALARLEALHVGVKILTGDSDVIAQFICHSVGLDGTRMLLGSQVALLDDAALHAVVDETTLFAKLTPDQKQRIIRALQANGHTVGFLGDGINDAPALKTADVGISVDSAADIAKESSDIILLDQDLGVLEQGVREGRRVFGNIIKYIRMAASSNFGNMFSMLGASALLPFVPMRPIQILLNNLLYDISQTAIPSDSVDPEWMEYPRKWEIGHIQKYILYIGPISTIFDMLTFVILIYGFGALAHPAFFQTAWFIESIFSQTLVIHVIRTNKIPFIHSMASRPLLLSSFVILAFAAWLTVSPFAPALGFVALPTSFWVTNFALLLAYIPLTQLLKVWFMRRYGI